MLFRSLASDLRYIDYKNADLWGARIINSGLNWNSVFAAARRIAS